jgi:hypothetical protein
MIEGRRNVGSLVHKAANQTPQDCQASESRDQKSKVKEGERLYRRKRNLPPANHETLGRLYHRSPVDVALSRRLNGLSEEKAATPTAGAENMIATTRNSTLAGGAEETPTATAQRPDQVALLQHQGLPP